MDLQSFLAELELKLVEAMVSIKLLYNLFIVFTASILTFLGLNAETFFLFSLLLFFDFITGIGKARALGQNITSDKMKYGIISKMSLVVIPLVLGIAAKAMQMPSGNILFIGMNILILSEAYSIIGNVYAIRTKDELPEYDALALLGKKIRTMLIRMSGGEDK